MRRMLVVVVVALALALTALPAAGHGGGFGLVPVLAPPEGLPAEVAVDVLGTQVASLLEVENPTDEVLEIEQADGTPWLRISSAGVEVASGAVDTYATTNPTGGSVPNDVLDGSRQSTWVRVTTEPRWSWFEHRMHPEGVAALAAAGADDAEELLAWEVTGTYGDDDVTIGGTLELRPPTGTIGATLTSDVPTGVELQVLPGGVPGLLLGLDGASEVVVVGVSGEDYLRFGPEGVEVDVASPTHRAVEAARGNELPPLPDGAGADWQPVTGGASHAWLETRARAPLDIPEEIRNGGVEVDLLTWAVPLRVDGEPVVVSGVTQWVPLTMLDEITEGGGEADGVGPWGWALVGVTFVVGALWGRAVRRRRA